MPVPSPLDPDDPSTRRPHVLVATADERLRTRLAAALRDAGLRVSTVEDGVALFERLETAGPRLPDSDIVPDIVIAEAELDGFSGLEILAMTSAGTGRPATILLSSRVDVQLRLTAQRLGATALVETPLDLDAVRTALRAALRARRGAPRAA